MSACISSPVSAWLWGLSAGVGHQRPGLGFEHHLAFLPGAATQPHTRLEQRELVGPGGEAARAAIVVELRQHRDQRVVGGLEGEVVELLAAYVRKRGAPARDLEASRAQEQLVQARDRLVTLGARGCVSALSHARESACARSGSLSAALIGRREVMPGPRLTRRLGSARAPLVFERRQDARRERRRAAALHQLDQCVQVHRALARELLGQPAVEAGLAQSRPAPGDDLGRSPPGAGCSPVLSSTPP